MPAPVLRGLGESGVSVSPVVFGAMARHGEDEGARIETLQASVEAGATSIDTAPLYEFGDSERAVGRAIAGMRERVQVLTKVGLRWDDHHGEVLFAFRNADGERVVVRRDSRPESVRLEVERSLERLRIERIDLVQVHHPDPLTPIAETMGALADLVRAGRVRAIGVSNYSAEQIRAARDGLGDVPLASVQSEYNLLRRDVEREVLPLAADTPFGLLAYSPLEQGLLAGRRPGSLDPDDPRRQNPTWQIANREAVRAALEGALLPLAEHRGAHPGQVALAWLLAQPGVSGVIAGASGPEQARQNAAAAGLELAPAESALLRRRFEAVSIDWQAGRGAGQRLRERLRRAARRARRLLG